jgi:hypothetical protein
MVRHILDVLAHQLPKSALPRGFANLGSRPDAITPTMALMPIRAQGNESMKNSFSMTTASRMIPWT